MQVARFTWALFVLLLCHLVILSSSRVCLLDVSRLLGLTLRPSALVCSCHRFSLTRWRLAFAQEAARVVPSASWRLFFCSLLCQVTLHHSQFSTKKSGHAWRRSKCITSWCFECILQYWWRTNHTNFQNTDSLVCVFFSCTCVVTF